MLSEELGRAGRCSPDAALGRLGGSRPRALPGVAAAAHLGAEGGIARPRQPGQSPPRCPAHVRPVPLRLRERRQRGRGQGAVRDLRRADAGCAAPPGGGRESQPVDRGEGGHEEPRTADPCGSSPARRSTRSRRRSPTPHTRSKSAMRAWPRSSRSPIAGTRSRSTAAGARSPIQPSRSCSASGDAHEPQPARRALAATR
jgi:hypothetical protein